MLLFLLVVGFGGQISTVQAQTDPDFCINIGGTEISAFGRTFLADNAGNNASPYFTGSNNKFGGPGNNATQGITTLTNAPLSVSEVDIFQTERFGGKNNVMTLNLGDGGNLTSIIGGDGTLPSGDYVVDLYFVELFIGVQNGSGVGARIFDVTLEGTLVLDDFDIFDVPDPDRPLTALAYTYDVNVTDGSLTVAFDASVDNGKLSAVCIRPDDDADTEAPVISVLGDNPLQLTTGDAYVEQGATATDNADSDIILNVVVDSSAVDTSTADTYTVTYNATDADGNVASQVTRTVEVSDPVTDTTPPTITLTGDNPLELTVGDTYVEQGATANDDVDGDISGDIVIDSSAVNTAVAGSYDVTYNVSDVAGNAATQVIRTVNVNQPVDEAPTLAPLVDWNNTVGDSVAIQTDASDDGAISYSITGAPTGISIDSNGLINGTITGAAGLYTDVTVTVDDSVNPTVSETFDWFVIPDVAEQCTVENTVAAINLGEGEVTAPNGVVFLADTPANLTSLNATLGGTKYAPGFMNGADVFNTNIAEIYRSERYGGAPGDPAMTYDVDLDNGIYVVELYIAEIFTNLGDANTNNDKERIMNVSVEGTTVFDSLHLYQQSLALNLADGDATNDSVQGRQYALPVTRVLVTVEDGTLNMSLSSEFDNGKLSAFCIGLVELADETAPTITLLGDNPQELSVGDFYQELGATASDDVDGDISDDIVIDASAVNTNAVGSYTVTYNVSDAAGNPATEVTRTVNVSEAPDTTPPVITLLGDNPLELTVGDTYVEPDATATDNVDGDISGDIVIDASTVNTNAVGSYTVTYNVSDAAGNPATEVTRTVNVSAVGVPSALVEITPNGDLGASTFTGSSFQITNNSTEGITIDSIVFDLSTAILPDMVFDPVGAGGDATASCLTPNSGATATGFVAPTDPCVDPFSVPRNGGFDVMTVNFSDFDETESFFFTTDIDPNSIQGVAGAGNAGAASGYELTGSTITITFSDGSVIVSSLYEDGSLGGSQAIVTTNATSAPSIEAQGVISPSVVNNLSQTIVLTGTPGDFYSLLQMDTRLFIASGDDPFDVSPSELPFYANEAMSGKNVLNGQIDGDGTVEIPITLLVTASGNTSPDGGLNSFIAVTSSVPYAVDQQVSQTSNVVTLKYEEVTNVAPTIDFLTSVTNSIAVQENEQTAVQFSVMDDDDNLDTVTVTGVDFVALNNDGGGIYTATFSPDADDSGTYLITVEATDTAGAVTTETFDLTVTEEPLASLTGTFTMQGRSDHSGVSLTVELYQNGVMVYQFTPTSTDDGGDGAFTVTGIDLGTYEVAVKSNVTLQVVETVTLASGDNSQDFGEFRAGDANGDNIVSSLDFSLLATSFNTTDGDANYNANTDFNGDGFVTSLDFSLLASNFNTSGDSVSIAP